MENVSTQNEAKPCGEEAYLEDAPSPSHSIIMETMASESDTETCSTSTQLIDGIPSPRSMIEEIAMKEDEGQTCCADVQAVEVPAILVISTIDGEAQTSEVALADAETSVDTTTTESEVQACSGISDGATQTQGPGMVDMNTETLPPDERRDRVPQTEDQLRPDSLLKVLNNGNIMLEFLDDAIEATLTPEASKHLAMMPRYFHSEERQTQDPSACFRDVKAASAVLTDIVRIAETFHGNVTVCTYQTYTPAEKCDPARHRRWLDELASNRVSLVGLELVRARQSPHTEIMKRPSVISPGSHNLVDWKFRVVGSGVDQVLSWHQFFGIGHKKRAAQSTNKRSTYETPPAKPKRRLSGAI